MAMELPTYRLHMERLNERFPDREMLTRQDIIDCTGMCLNAVRNHFPFRGTYITKVEFARRLSQCDRA